MENTDLSKITEPFDIKGKLLSVKPYGSGHIHKTYLSTWDNGSTRSKYIHQSINDKVFTDVNNLMLNISTVLRHLNGKIKGNEYSKIEIIPAKDGALYSIDKNNHYWRTYNYIDNTKYFDVTENKSQVREAGRITGYFQKQLIDLDVSSLNENIRKFTSSPHRLDQFKQAVSAKPQRISNAKDEIKFVEMHAEFTNLIDNKLREGTIPKRVVHGDTKINNVLFSSDTDKAVCLVDLDTCMPGYSLFDYGDLARSVSTNVAEDEQDFSKIKFNQEFFTALTEGYLGQAKSFLNSHETGLMHLVPQLIALTLGIRFLTDYLNSDIYFKISRPLHNLERARTQFKIFETFKTNEELMIKIIKNNLQ